MTRERGTVARRERNCAVRLGAIEWLAGWLVECGMRRRRVLLVLGVAVGLALAWVIFAAARPVRPYAALWHAEGMQGTRASSVPCAVFYVTNLSDRNVVLVGGHVETRVGNTWRLYTNCTVGTVVTGRLVGYQGLVMAPCEGGCLVIGPPPTAEWRLQVEVSRETHGLGAVAAWCRDSYIYRSWFGWRIWKWPPFGKTLKVAFYSKPLKLTSEPVHADGSEH